MRVVISSVVLLASFLCPYPCSSQTTAPLPQASQSPQASQPSQSDSCDEKNICNVQLGLLTLHVQAVPTGFSIALPIGTQLNESDLAMFSVSINNKELIGAPDLLPVPKSQATTGSKTNTLTANALASRINALNKGIVAQVTQQSNTATQNLDLRTSSATSRSQLSLPHLTVPSVHVESVTIWRNFVLSLDPTDVAKLRKDHTRVSVRTSDGSVFSLYDGYSAASNSWTYISDRGPSDRGRMIVVRLDKAIRASLGAKQGTQEARASQKTKGTQEAKGTQEVKGTQEAKCASDWFGGSDPDSYARYCNAEFVIVRRNHVSGDTTVDNLVLGMKTNEDGRLEIYQDAIVGSDYKIDGTSLVLISSTSVSWLDPGPTPWLIEWFADTGTRCRPAPHDPRSQQYAAVVVHPPAHNPDDKKDNGIVVGAAKIFDALALQKMLNDTATQLAGLSVFNGAQISSAVGTLQGISRDTSYVNAQLTTVPTAATTQSSSTGVTTPNTVQTTTPIGSTTVTLQCPDGSLPTIGSSTTLGGCAPVPMTGATPSVPVYAPVSNSGTLQGTLTTTPAGSSTTNTGTTTATQNGTTNSTSSVAGVAPSALVSNPLTAPNNVAVASSDILAEQVQLNAQLISLRLLLQGALSDQFLSRNAIAVGLRRQTTLGFSISLDAPRQFKHAVAEVRVVVYPPNGLDPNQNRMSLMTLLPAEKTYNVAKVTSHQNAFGAGAVIEPISFGLSAGKSKDRLYLAKDTDTLAMQFQSEATPIRRPWPARLHTGLKSIVQSEPLEEGCRDADPDIPPEAIVFGWQFRPVLGEDYVLGGQRQVFAQIALPGTDSQGYYYPPRVSVQTYWREYNPNSQTVGEIYEDSCSSAVDQSDIALINQTHVDDIQMTDLGAGQVSLKAKGQFYLSSLGVIAGANTLIPRAFDGSSIQVIAGAHDLLEAGDLTLVNASGQTIPFAIEPPKDRSCNITAASMKAVPYADGNSRATVMLDLGTNYNVSVSADGPPHPLVMIGDGVYGLKETQFLDLGGLCFTFGTTPANGQVNVNTRCQYNFIAPTTALRNAQTFQVTDLTWKGFTKSNRITFAPSFSSITVSSSPDSSTAAGAATNSGVTSYTVQGFDFSRISLHCTTDGESLTPCLRIFVGDRELSLSEIGFTVESDNFARMTLNAAQLGKAKTVRFLVQWEKDDPGNTVELAIAPKTDASKPVPTPAFLRVGDSQRVSFTGGDLCPSTKTYIVTFEGSPLVTACNGSSLDVLITSSVTKLYGHKEFSLTAGGAAIQAAGSPVSLAIDVLRQ